MAIEEQNLRDAADKCICDCTEDFTCRMHTAPMWFKIVAHIVTIAAAWVLVWFAVGFSVGVIHHIK